MEAPIPRVVIFRLTGGTHGKVRHGGLVAIIRDILDNRITRPAVGTVDKGIAVASVDGVQELGQAIRAGANIGGNQRGTRLLSLALDDAKTVQRSEGLLHHLHLNDLSKWWCFSRNVPDKRLDCSRQPSHLDLDAIGLIPNPAGKLAAISQLKDKGAKPYSLHDTSNPYRDAPLGRVGTRIQADALLREVAGYALRVARCRFLEALFMV